MLPLSWKSSSTRRSWELISLSVGMTRMRDSIRKAWCMTRRPRESSESSTKPSLNGSGKYITLIYFLDIGVKMSTNRTNSRLSYKPKLHMPESRDMYTMMWLSSFASCNIKPYTVDLNGWSNGEPLHFLNLKEAHLVLLKGSYSLWRFQLFSIQSFPTTLFLHYHMIEPYILIHYLHNIGKKLKHQEMTRVKAKRKINKQRKLRPLRRRRSQSRTPKRRRSKERSSWGSNKNRPQCLPKSKKKR